MRDHLKMLRFVVVAGWALFAACVVADRASAQTFPGLLQPGQVSGNNGTAPAPARPIPARTQLIAAQNYWVNGNSVATAACGNSGASTCSAGSDSNNCLTAATACLTLQHVVNLILYNADLAGFTATIFLAHGTSSNYSATCEGGPVIGQSTMTILGDSTAPTAATIQIPTGAGQNALTYKDGCTWGVGNVGFVDNAAGNGGNFINGGTGQAGHIDLTNVTFGTLHGGNGIAVALSYGPATATIVGCSITGNLGAFFNIGDGAVLDLSGGVCTGSSGLTFSIAFGLYNSGGVVLAAAANFSGFSGVTGSRCNIDGPVWFEINPNAVFPGSANCTATVEVGAIGVQNNAGPNINYGSVGQPLLSGGGGGASPNVYATLGAAGGGTGATSLPTGAVKANGTQVTGQAACGDLSDSTAPCNASAAGLRTYTEQGSQLISVNTISSTANYQDTTSITSACDDYEIVFSDLIPATNNVNIEILLHSNGSFQNTSYINATGGVTTFDDPLISGGNLGNTDGASFFLYLYGVNSSVHKKTRTIGSYISGSSTMLAISGSAAWTGGTTAIDGFEVLMSSGNIASGKVKVYCKRPAL